MSVYAFNENLEKVQFITLTGSMTIPAGEVGTLTWNTSALTNAGVDTNNLLNYAILDVLHTYGSSGDYWTSGTESGYVSSSPVSGYPDQIKPAPIVKIDNYSKQITLSDYTGDNSAQSKSYKIRLIKVA